LFYKHGPLLRKLPSDVRVLETKSDFRYMGMAQADCRTVRDKIRRGIYVAITRCFGQKWAVRFAALTLGRDRLGQFDVAVSYSHLAANKQFYGATAEYVLRTDFSKKKLCYIHCDYLNAGVRTMHSDRVYSQFDAIACVSESTRARFLSALPEMKDRVYTAKNLIDAKTIRQQASMEPISYDKEYLNLVSVARLGEEKGIERFVRVLSTLDCTNIRYYVVGDGKEREKIEQLILQSKLSDVVTLVGEDPNPYRYLLYADLLAVPSYHEAAPVVFQEAKVLGVPVLTTRTTSADEMIGMQYGFVVDNSEEAMKQQVEQLFQSPEALVEKKQQILGQMPDEQDEPLEFDRIISKMMNI